MNSKFLSKENVFLKLSKNFIIGNRYLRNVNWNVNCLSFLFNLFIIKPSVILHSAAERRPDKVENEEEKTQSLNVDATQFLCDLASRNSLLIIKLRY